MFYFRFHLKNNQFYNIFGLKNERNNDKFSASILPILFLLFFNQNLLIKLKIANPMASKFYQLAILFSLATLLAAAPCPSSQYTANDGNCLSCPSTCTTCANADYCTSCNLGYYLVVASFNVTCQTCSQIFGGCKTCLSNVACTACNEGYFISNNICRPCSTNTLYCTKCSVDGSICSACNYPFILQGGMCVS